MNAQHGGGVEPPGDGSFALRMRRVEEGLSSVNAELGSVKAELVLVKADVAIIKSNYATKEDLHREIGAQTWRLVTFVCAFGTVLVSATYFVARLGMAA